MMNVTENLTGNLTELAVHYPGEVYTSWGNVNELVALMLIVGFFFGWAVGYQCYHYGIRFPWHKDDE